jgi:hypothetical protein
VQVERQRIAFGDSDGTLTEGLTPVTKMMNRYARGEPMEIDHLRRAEEDGDEDGCECNALQEQGFRGPCYYCQRRGHMIRSCPRKSAGLPRVRTTETPKPVNPARRPMNWNKGKTPFKKVNKPLNKRVNQIEGEEDECDHSEDEGVQDDQEEDERESVHFLEERL